MTSFGYRGYGLSLVSELELPEFLPTPAADHPDIRIRLDTGALDAWEDNAGLEEEFFAARLGGHLLRVSGVAVYHVTGGREISIPFSSLPFPSSSNTIGIVPSNVPLAERLLSSIRSTNRPASNPTISNT